MIEKYLAFLVAVGGTGGLMVLAVRAIYGKGLATKLFATLIPLLMFAGFSGYVMGSEGTWPVFFGAIGLGALIISPSLLWMHKVAVGRLQEHAASLVASSSQLSATAKETAATAAQQSATVSEVSSTIGELRETSSAASAFAEQVVSGSADVLEKGQQGMKAVENARDVLELISQVGEIVEAIRDFAGQSNLLAVNARVEAAKAGEHGRGFAVVASEIRNLAEQSRDSAQRIWKAVTRAEEGRRSLEEASDRMRDLLGALDASVDNARQIAATVGQQSVGIQQISEAMSNVAEGGRASADATGQVEQAIVSLRSVADELQTYITGSRAVR